MVTMGTLDKDYTVLDDVEKLKTIYQSEDSPKKRKGLIRKPLWKKKSSVKGCEDCTKNFKLFKDRWRCLLCGQVLCKPCVKNIPSYILTSTKDEKSFDIKACGRCVVRLEEQYRKKQEDNNLKETTMKLKEQVQLWNATWDKYITVNQSRGQSSESNEIYEEMLKCMDEVSYYKNELVINWRDDNGVITRETYDDIMSTCDEIIEREKSLEKDSQAVKKKEDYQVVKKKKKCCCCFRHCLRWFRCCGVKEENDKDETEYKLDETAQAVTMTKTQNTNL